MISLLIGSVIELALVYMGIIYTSPGMVIVGMSLLVYEVLAVLYLFYQSIHLKARVKIPIVLAQKDQPVNTRVEIRNTSCFAVPYMRCDLVYQNRLSGKKKIFRVKGSEIRKGENVYKFCFTPKGSGMQSIELKKIRLYDWTGFFYWKKKFGHTADFQIFPKILSAGIQISQKVWNFYGEADVYDTERPGYDSSEIFQIREFQPGDKIQSIHWKLSAKTDTLMIRESSYPKVCSIVILLSQKARKGKKQQKGEAFWSVAASLSYTLMDQKCPHYMAWYDRKEAKIQRIRVEDEESFYQFLNQYPQEWETKEIPNLQMLYQDQYRREPYLHLLYLNEDLQLYMDQEKVAGFGPRDYKEQLQQIGLVL